ncbi:MAG: hypothetical protein KA288_09020 [Paludibacteraceae bacterium]|jgi:hypothetical protein|nr:hypothetical protein [Paludibacteraceae bacterium]
MPKRGRPAKVFSATDFENLRTFLQQLPFLKKAQEKALNLLQNSSENFDDQQFKILKFADREKILYQQKQTLLEQIKIKQKNQQKLLQNEAEILALSALDLDQETFFRLDRALESYQKIQKAVLDDRIRLENERRREILQKTGKAITEAQKKRNEENRRKYEIGGAVLAAFKKLDIKIETDTPEQIHNRIVNSHQFVSKVKSTKIFKQIVQQQNNFFRRQNLFIDVLEGLSTWSNRDQKLSTIEIEKHKDKYNS